VDPAAAEQVGEMVDPLLPGMRVERPDHWASDTSGRLWCTWDGQPPRAALFDGQRWTVLSGWDVGGEREVPVGRLQIELRAKGAMLFLDFRGRAYLHDEAGWAVAAGVPELIRQHPERVQKVAGEAPLEMSGIQLLRDAKGRVWWTFGSSAGVVEGQKAHIWGPADLGIKPRDGKWLGLCVIAPLGETGRMVVGYTGAGAAVVDLVDGKVVRVADAPVLAPAQGKRREDRFVHRCTQIDTDWKAERGRLSKRGSEDQVGEDSAAQSRSALVLVALLGFNPSCPSWISSVRICVNLWTVLFQRASDAHAEGAPFLDDAPLADAPVLAPAQGKRREDRFVHRCTQIDTDWKAERGRLSKRGSEDQVGEDSAAQSRSALVLVALLGFNPSCPSWISSVRICVNLWTVLFQRASDAHAEGAPFLDDTPLAEAPDGTVWAFALVGLARLRVEGDRIVVAEEFPVPVGGRGESRIRPSLGEHKVRPYSCPPPPRAPACNDPGGMVLMRYATTALVGAGPRACPSRGTAHCPGSTEGGHRDPPLRCVDFVRELR
jgi:hypothetical protein